MVKPVSYDKVQEITQEKDENLAVFLSQVTEAFRKHTNIDRVRRREDTIGHAFYHSGYSKSLEKIIKA